jgi:hypothetical protein
MCHEELRTRIRQEMHLQVDGYPSGSNVPTLQRGDPPNRRPAPLHRIPGGLFVVSGLPSILKLSGVLQEQDLASLTDKIAKLELQIRLYKALRRAWPKGREGEEEAKRT